MSFTSQNKFVFGQILFFTDISDLLKVALLQRLLGSDHFNPFFGDYRKDKSSDLSMDYKEGSSKLFHFTTVRMDYSKSL